MQEKKDKIKDLAYNGLSQFEADPPEDMWARIEQQSRRRKNLIFIYRLSIAATVLIMVGLGISLLIPGNTSIINRNQIHVVAKRTITNDSGDQVTDNAAIDKKTIRITQSDKDQISAKNILTDTRKLNKTDRPAEKDIVSIEPEKETEIISLVTSETDINEETSAPIISTEIAVAQALSVPVNEDSLSRILQQQAAQSRVDEKQENRSWGLAMGYGTTPSIELTQEDYAMNSGNTSFSYDEMSSGVANETSYFDEVENTTHNTPITLGLILSRQLAKKWNLETGLVYTQLGYQIKTSELNQTYHIYRNEIYYLGIPLGVRFGIIDRKRFGIYASQSLIIEKGIAGRIYNDTYNQGQLTGSENNSVSIRGIQLSSLTGIGADLRITPKISFYGQAGFQLFFLNASQPYNIRSARMTWPSFQAGLRIRLN